MALGLMVQLGFSRDKTRDWQTGKLISIEQGIPESSPGIVLAGTNPPLVIHAEYKAWTYIIETENMVYGFSAQSEHPRPFTINSQVKFALEPKGRVFLITGYLLGWPTNQESARH
jgi:hypothetical protein